MSIKNTYRLLIFGLLIIILSGCCGLNQPTGTPATPSPDKINVLADPVQYSLSNPQNIVVTAQGMQFLVTPLYGYNIAAKIMSKQNYWGDWKGELCPYDLALAWGDLTKPEVEKHMSYSQSGRWYYFHYDGQCPVSEAYIYEHSANNHILPATKNLYSVMAMVQPNNIIYLEGYLVKINGTVNGAPIWWNSSTSRGDRGDGSCEVFYVNKIIYDNKVYI